MPGVRLRLEDRALEERYYVRFKGRVLGPMSKDKTIELIRRGQISRMHELSPDGLAWKPAEDLPSCFPRRWSQFLSNTAIESRGYTCRTTCRAVVRTY